MCDDLIRAADQGDLKLLKTYVSKGINYRYLDDYALRWAAKNGHLEVVRYLISLGCDPKNRNSQALKWAAESGHVNVIKCLIAADCSTEVLNDNEIYKQHIMHRKMDAFNYLKSIGFTLRKTFEMFDLSVRYGHLDIVKTFVEDGYSVHTLSTDILTSLIRDGFMDVMEYLLEMGYDPRNGNNYVLIYCVVEGRLNLVKKFIELGCDPLELDIYCLRHCVMNGHVDMLKFLIEKGCDIMKILNYGPHFKPTNTTHIILEHIFRSGHHIEENQCEELFWISLLDATLTDFAEHIFSLLSFKEQIKFLQFDTRDEILKEKFHVGCHLWSDQEVRALLDVGRKHVEINNIVEKVINPKNTLKHNHKKHNLFKNSLKPTSQHIQLIFI
jgi:hypothetical protein